MLKVLKEFPYKIREKIVEDLQCGIPRPTLELMVSVLGLIPVASIYINKLSVTEILIPDNLLVYCIYTYQSLLCCILVPDTVFKYMIYIISPM